MNLYYIHEAAGVQGPFDLLSMIRKAKNGTLQRQTAVALDAHETPQPAESFDELRTILDEEEHALATPQGPRAADQSITLMNAFRSGWENFQLNQTTAVLTGVFAIIAVLGMILLSLVTNGIVAGILCSIWAFFVFDIYLVALLRKTRMQLLNAAFFQRLLKKNGLTILLASLLAAIVPGVLPALLAPVFGKFTLLVVLVPSSLAIAYLVFLPLIISDRQVGLGQALLINKEKMAAGGINFFSVIYGLLATNFIIPVFPVTMPVTLGAACDLYDRVFNDY